MMKISSKLRNTIESGLKRFSPIVRNLKGRGTSSSEDDARIILNDLLSDVLGYDKYNELTTEQRERNGRLDYAVKLQDGPNVHKKDKFDFIIEAKAIHVELSSKHIDQTLSYCLTTNTKYFILTNVLMWRIYKVIPAKKDKKPQAKLIYELDFSSDNHMESLTEEFYIFSKSSFLSDNWSKVASYQKAANVNDIFTILVSDKSTKNISKLLKDIHGVRVSQDMIREVLESKIAQDSVEINTTLLKQLNSVKKKLKTKHSNKNHNEIIEDSISDEDVTTFAKTG